MQMILIRRYGYPFHGSECAVLASGILHHIVLLKPEQPRPLRAYACGGVSKLTRGHEYRRHAPDGDERACGEQVRTADPGIGIDATDRSGNYREPD